MVGRNGVGKSSLWHIMTFLYYGISPTKATKSVLQMDTKDFLIEGSFEKEGVRYWCATAQKSKEKSPMGEPYGTGYFLYKKTEAGWENISWHKATDTQKLVKDLLGWSLEEWYGYVYLAQQTSHTLINGTPAERQKYLSALFNLEPLDVIAEYYKAKALTEESKVREIQKKQDEIVLLENMRTVARFKDWDAASFEQEIENTKFEIEDSTFLLSEAEAEQKRFDELHALTQEWSVLVPDDFEKTGQEQLDFAQNELEHQLTRQAEHKATSTQHQALKLKTDTLGVKLGRLMTAVLPDDYAHIMQAPDISLASEQSRLDQLERIKFPVNAVAPEPVPQDHEIIMGYQDIDLLRTRAEIAKIRARPQPPECVKPEPEDLDMLGADQANAHAKIKLLNEKREQLMLEGTCPTCGSELNAEHRASEQTRVDQELQDTELEWKTITALADDLKTKRNLWAEYEKQGLDRSAELPELEAQVARYEQKVRCRVLVQANESWTKHLESVERVKEIPTIRESIRLYNLKSQYRTLADQLKERDLIKIQHEEMQVEVQGLQHILDGLSYSPETIELLKRQIESFKEALALGQKIKLLQAQNPQDVTEKIQMFRENVTELQTRLGQSQAQLKELTELTGRIQALSAEVSGGEALVREQKKCEILAKAYGKAGKIRQGQLSKFTGYLKDALTCHTYQQLSEHKLSFDVGDGIEINTSKNGCIPYDVSLMSGGEKGALSGAFLFALDDMQPSDRRTSLKIIDELESAFDPERKQSYFDYMLPELRSRAETVIVISHTPVDDQTLFDRTWEVKNGKIEDISGETREYEVGETNAITENLVGASSEPALVGARPKKRKLAARAGRGADGAPDSSITF